MNKVTDWIKRHQIVAFFIITITITWGLEFSYGVVIKQGQFLLAPLMFVATCGPALAGICAPQNTSPYQSSGRGWGIRKYPVRPDRTVVVQPRGVLVQEQGGFDDQTRGD